MRIRGNRSSVLTIAGAVTGWIVVVAGVWFVIACGTGPTPPAPSASPSTSPSTMIVKVFFHKGTVSDPDVVVPIQRTVPASLMVATAAMNQLLAGPTAAERDAGYWSFFSDQTVGMLLSVQVADGVARADFRDFSRIIPNASSSTGSAALLAELNATLKQFGNVTSTVYSFNGDVAAFYEWLQMVAPGAPPWPKDAVATARPS